MQLSNSIYTDNVGLSQINKILNTTSRKLVVNVRGIGSSGLRLQYLDGRYSEDGLSLSKAVALNSLMSALSRQERESVEVALKEMLQNKSSTAKVTKTTLKVLKSVKSAYPMLNSSLNNSMLNESIKGIVLNTLV